MLQDKVLHQSLVYFISMHSAVWCDYFLCLVTSIMRKCRAKPRPGTGPAYTALNLDCNVTHVKTLTFPEGTQIQPQSLALIEVIPYIHIYW